MIYKKLLILSAVGVVSYATTNFNFVNSQAALSAPADYAVGYFQNPVSADWVITKKTGGTATYNPGFVRTGTSPDYTYDNGLGGTGWDYGDFPTIIPQGITINLRFNESNTGWISGGFGMYYPDGGAIGSTGKTPNFDNVKIEINNQTNKDYHLYFDISSSNNVIQTLTLQNGSNIWSIYDAVYYNGADGFLERIAVPAYTTLTIRSHAFGNANNNITLDAFYLVDLGVSASYNEGYDQGETDGYDSGLSDGYDVGFEQGEIVGYEDGYENGLNNGLAATPIENIFTAIFSGIANIFNIQIFGNITLGTIIIAPIAVALLWYILGIVSGVGGKK